MAEKQTLITLDVVTDDDTGMYQVGEVDFGIRNALEQHIKKRGAEELLLTMTYLIYHIKDVEQRITASALKLGDSI